MALASVQHELMLQSQSSRDQSRQLNARALSHFGLVQQTRWPPQKAKREINSLIGTLVGKIDSMDSVQRHASPFCNLIPFLIHANIHTCPQHFMAKRCVPLRNEMFFLKGPSAESHTTEETIRWEMAPTRRTELVLPLSLLG